MTYDKTIKIGDFGVSATRKKEIFFFEFSKEYVLSIVLKFELVFLVFSKEIFEIKSLFDFLLLLGLKRVLLL